MNWIKSNPFVSILSAVTLVVCGILAFVALSSSSKYKEMKSSFDSSFQNVNRSERSALYPTAENRAAKTKALAEYQESIEELRSLYDPYRVTELDQISPQEFTVRLKAASGRVSGALGDAGCEIPEGFFLGFESYRTKLAESGSTALLDYQLKGFESALLSLAEARPSELLKIYREPIPEESGGTYEAPANEVSRKFGMEVMFRGSEQSAREFLSALGEIDEYYFIVRSISISNENQSPPQVSDASFEKQERPVRENSEEANPFGSGFVLPGAEDENTDEVLVNEDSDQEVVEESPEPEIDTTRILAQVLGGEEVVVFVRFDLTLFTAKAELPKP